jgi:hypothetical protein
MTGGPSTGAPGPTRDVPADPLEDAGRGRRALPAEDHGGRLRQLRQERGDVQVRVRGYDACRGDIGTREETCERRRHELTCQRSQELQPLPQLPFLPKDKVGEGTSPQQMCQ